jgi:hypothetical protein
MSLYFVPSSVRRVLILVFSKFSTWDLNKENTLDTSSFILRK